VHLPEGYTPECVEEEFWNFVLRRFSEARYKDPNITQIGDAALRGRGQHAREGEGWAHLFYDWAGKEEH
jgi:hypothetical protein